MPPPTICSWFMEDHLRPYIHYIPILKETNIKKKINTDHERDNIKTKTSTNKDSNEELISYSNILCKVFFKFYG